MLDDNFGVLKRAAAAFSSSGRLIATPEITTR
jgi:hypothetical protein